MAHGTLDVSPITDFISLGTNACCQTHFAEALLRRGVVADISLEQERLDAPWGVRYFLWLPTPDGNPPHADQLWLGVRAISDLECYGVKVYVHCKNGHGRAPTLVAAYLIHRGFTVAEAVSRITQQRPAVHLSASQWAALEEFAAVVRTEGTVV